MLRYLSSNRILLQQEIKQREQVIRAAGNLLVEDLCAKPEYVDAMVQLVDEMGPYIVVAPGVALAHARPEEGAVKEAISLVTLSTPVYFGHPDNDPVDIIFGVSATSADKHLELMSLIANCFQQQGFACKLRSTKDVTTLMEEIPC